MLSRAKKRALNRLFDYIPAFRKGQFKKSEGDIRLGDLVDGYRIVTILFSAIVASPTNANEPLAEVGDVIFIQLISDDTGGPLGALSGIVPYDGTVQITPANAPTNNDGITLILVLRAQR